MLAEELLPVLHSLGGVYAEGAQRGFSLHLICFFVLPVATLGGGILASSPLREEGGTRAPGRLASSHGTSVPSAGASQRAVAVAGLCPVVSTGPGKDFLGAERLLWSGLFTRRGLGDCPSCPLCVTWPLGFCVFIRKCTVWTGSSERLSSSQRVAAERPRLSPERWPTGPVQSREATGQAGEGGVGLPGRPRGPLPCDTALFPQTAPPWTLLPSSLILFPLLINRPKEGDASVSHFSTLFTQPEITPLPPVLPDRAFSCLKGMLDSLFPLTVGISYLPVVTRD